LQTGLAGFGGLTLPALLRANEAATSGDRKSVILFWLSGGPSHLDMWDPKPDAPREIRGPFSSIESCGPGIRVCEHLPKPAAHMGSQFAPVDGGELAGRIALPQGIQLDRLGNRDELRRQFDQLLRDRDRTETMANADRYTAQAMDLVTSGHAAKAFDLSQEKD